MLARDSEIEALVAELRASPWLALDTEADSLHAYPEKLCLIQISHAGGDALVDPLSAASLAPLLEHLAGRELILHGADFDLRLLRRTRGFVAAEVFDTAIAAQLLGRPRHGLRDLVRELLGVELHKGSQHADWSRRPLSAQLLAYAMNDTRHLCPLRAALAADLLARGRLDWHRETCARLVKTCAVPSVPDLERAWRLKGSVRLDRRGLAVLRELWRWREALARTLDRPPYFVLGHEVLLDLAAPAARGDSVVPATLKTRDRRGLEEALARGLELPNDALPAREAPDRPPPVTREVARRIDALRARRDHLASALEIDPSLIATKAEIAALAEDHERGLAGLMTWQAGLLAP